MQTATDDFTEKFRQLGNIPTLPQAATKALAIVNDPSCSVKDFCKVIENDPALATSLLKLVNSSFYATDRRISNLQAAVTRLGTRETQNLILAVSVRSVFRWMPREQQEERMRLWRHSALTAVLCRQINAKLGLGYKGEEFSAGLAHDLGRIMLAVGYPDVFSKLAEKKFIDEDALLEEEMRLLRFTHPELGAWLTSYWNLPSDLTETIRFHHRPEEAGDHRVLASIVNLAEQMANYNEAHHSIEGIDLSSKPGWTVLRTQWPAIDELDPEKFVATVFADAAPEAEQMALLDVS